MSQATPTPLSKLAMLESILRNLATAQELEAVLNEVAGIVRTIQRQLIVGASEGPTYPSIIQEVRSLKMAVEASLDVLLGVIMIARSASADGTEQTTY